MKNFFVFPACTVKPASRRWILSYALVWFSLFLWGCSKHHVVILISLDTLRPDHLGCYGYARHTSPSLDAFAAKDAVLFESAYAQAPYTLPSHMSLLTSLYPETHGVLKPTTQDSEDAQPRTTRLAESVVTLAEIMKSHGCITSAFTDGGLVSAKYGFDQGFDEYRDERAKEGSPNGFRRFGPGLRQWIRDHSKDDFFLFIHTFDTHGPYDPPPPFFKRFKGEPPGQELPNVSLSLPFFLKYHDYQKLERFDDLQGVVDAYDGCVAYVDSEVGRLFDLLKSLGLWEDSLIVVTSDHGESFMENGLTIGHAIFLNQEEVRIPLLIKFPGQRFAGRRVDAVVESVDVLPTLLSSLDWPVPPGDPIQGQDLLQGLEHGTWEKNYAFGVSPTNGGNHYLYRDGIKYVESGHDPDFSLLVQALKPVDPLSYMGSTRTYLLKGKKIYYDLETDPLGLKELFIRGDRVYNLTRAASERTAPEITDPEVYEAYRGAATRLVKRCRAEGANIGAPDSVDGEQAPGQTDALAALGYGGMFNEDGNKTGESSAEVEFPCPPLVDRSLLYEGDLLLQQLKKSIEEEENPSKQACRALYDRVQDHYNRFLKSYPDREAWVRWRREILATVREEAEKKDLL